MNYLGLDIGTTGAKALVVDARGTVLGKGYAGYELISDGCNVEQRADDWTECGAQAIRLALQNCGNVKISAISMSTQGASTVAVDKHGSPIGNALTWMDSRSKAETIEISQIVGDDYIYRNTGWPISPTLDLAKIMHMKKSPKYKDARVFLSTLEYMNHFLTGHAICDPTNASIRQVFNVNSGDYDDMILKKSGICRSELPDILPTCALVGTISSAAAAQTGLEAGTPVYNGAHDQYCASIGAACVQRGDMLLSAGTTWVVMGISDTPLFTETKIAPAAHPIDGLYGAIASLVGSGASLQWFKNNFLSEDFDEINNKVKTRIKENNDLFFYPYLSGAYYPLWNAQARGAFTGLSLEHDKYDFACAIMEATAFGVARTLDDFAANGSVINVLRIMGGAAKSEIWCRLIAAAINKQVEISSESEACALGAAIIAAKGFGTYNSLKDAVGAMAAKTKSIVPDPALVKQFGTKQKDYWRMWKSISNYYI